MMKVELGDQGLENSWQAPFPENTPCVHGCAGIAVPAVCLMEEFSEEQLQIHVCSLPEPFKTLDSNEEDAAKMLWPHDLTAFVIYLCPVCLKPTALFNQA